MLLSFGPFLLDTQTRTLKRGDSRVELTSKEIDTLIVLAQAAGNPVDTETLLRTVWSGTTVVVNNLARRISDLRRKLGKSDSGQHYILTLPNRGYVLAADITVIEPTSDTLRSQRERSQAAEQSGLVSEQHQQVAGHSGATGVARRPESRIPGSPARTGPSLLATMIAISCLVAGISAWLIADRPIRVSSYVQLTNDGLQKHGPVLTDGRNVYFEAFLDREWIAVGAQVTGGDTVPIQLPVKSAHILDISPERPEFLISGRNQDAQECLWSWIPGHAPKPIVISDAQEAAWLNGKHSFAETAFGKLRIFDGMGLKTVLNHNAVFPRWSPKSAQLRFTHWDAKTETNSIWETRDFKSNPKQLPRQPPDSCCGTWTADSSFFTFQVRNGEKGEIWAMHERFAAILHRHPQPFPLTGGHMSYSWPAPSPDGKSIFALAEIKRGELVRYDARRGFQSYLGGVSGTDLDWTRDAQSIAYISFPDKALWTINGDGRGRVQLTFPPMSAAGPHWSPGGKRIAFMGQSPGKGTRVYLISASGGIPVEAAPSARGDQGIPTWSPDGSKLIFGELQYRKPPAEMKLYTVDVRTGAVIGFGGRTGLWTPRWSPDGRWVIAMSPDFTKLMLFDFAKSSWSELVGMRSIDDPTWTADSRHVHFRALDESLPSNQTILALYRVDIYTKKIDRLVSLRNISPALSHRWFGVTPDGAPVAMREMGVQEIFVLKLE